MAIQTFVFFTQEKPPTREQLQRVLDEEGLAYCLPADFDLTQREESVANGHFETLESCFDYMLDDYSADDWQWDDADLPVLGHPQRLVFFNTWSNAQEIVGMISVAAALAKHTQGVLMSDFFSEQLIPATDVIAFAKEIIENSREQFSGPSALRSGSNDAQDDDEENVDVGEIAEQILTMVKQSTIAEHRFQAVSLSDYDALDHTFYAQQQAALAALGFVWVTDVEDLTLTQNMGLRTMVRVLHQPETHATAALFYLAEAGRGFVELETFGADGRFVIDTTAPESASLMMPVEAISIRHHADEPSVAGLYAMHLTHCQQVLGSGQRLPVATHEAVVSLQNQMNRCKYDAQAQQGWVSREWLQHQFWGDDEMAAAVYDEIQRLAAF